MTTVDTYYGYNIFSKEAHQGGVSQDKQIMCMCSITALNCLKGHSLLEAYTPQQGPNRPDTSIYPSSKGNMMSPASIIEVGIVGTLQDVPGENMCVFDVEVASVSANVNKKVAIARLKKNRRIKNSQGATTLDEKRTRPFTREASFKFEQSEFQLCTAVPRVLGTPIENVVFLCVSSCLSTSSSVSLLVWPSRKQ